jgi:decaprenylphospho-beta-D-erythro-pentofuranosid-2-ulose 2-reductase
MNIVVLGGNSDLSIAVIEQLMTESPMSLTLGCRDLGIANTRKEAMLKSFPDTQIQIITYEATDPKDHARVLENAKCLGEIDLVMIGFGLLGDDFTFEQDWQETHRIMETNFSSVVFAILAASKMLLSQNNSSDIIVFGSVASQRTRLTNTVYGACKSGIESFCRTLGDALVSKGVHLLVVRPGFTVTKMTDGRLQPPFATTPENVAKNVITGLQKRRRVVWSPRYLRLVYKFLHILPARVWLRLSARY